MNQTISISINTRAGVLKVEISENPSYPGFSILWGEQQIAIIEAEPGRETPWVLVWEDGTEDPTHIIKIRPEASSREAPELPDEALEPNDAWDAYNGGHVR